MRYLPTILRAGLLLSVGLLAGSGPARAAMPTLVLDRSAIADMATATTAHIMAMATATDGPIMVMDMGVAGVTERGRNINLNSRVQSKPVATSARSLSGTRTSPLAERNPARVRLHELDFFVR